MQIDGMKECLFVCGKGEHLAEGCHTITSLLNLGTNCDLDEMDKFACLTLCHRFGHKRVATERSAVTDPVTAIYLHATNAHSDNNDR